jgi:DNA-binding response OmpR family regulator
MHGTQPGAQPHIWLVEDDEDMVTLLQFYLEREGYRVTATTDGRLAKEVIESAEPPQLALLDVMLPYVGGDELLKYIRNHPIWWRVPIIMLTALSAERGIVRMLDAGASDYIIKPFNPQDLTARVRHVLSLAS